MKTECVLEGPSTDEQGLIKKMKAAYAMRECLGYLAEQASSEEFHRTTALINSAIAAMDDEMEYSTRAKLRPEQAMRIPA